MSEPLRIGFVVEGTTDYIVLRQILLAILGDRDVEITVLQPEGADALRAEPGETGVGWPGVYRWCRQAADQGGGRVSANFLVTGFDVVVIHLDADVADSTYAKGHIHDAPSPHDLPCAQPCPPPSATTGSLRRVMLGWMGEAAAVPSFVLCTPSKALEAWILAALYPSHHVVVRGSLECRPDPAALLGSRPAAERLVSGGKKLVERYRGRAPAIAAGWAAIRASCTEAESFHDDLESALPR